jgi:hypothetical protein
MSVTPSPIGGFAAQFFDNNGVILSGGKIYTYAAGTTTPQATYTSASGVTPHANPIILDSAGRVPGGEIWLTDGLVYKFVIETATNILLGTYDNITGVNSNFVNYTVQEEVITATAGQTVFNLTTINYTPGTNSLTVYIDGVNQYVGDSYLETDSDTVTFTSGVHVGGEVKFTTAIQTTTGAVDASTVSYDPPFTGAVLTNVENKLAQYVSVKDFGAVGDGVANDTAAILAAIATGKPIYFPRPSVAYTTSQMINMTTPRALFADPETRIKLTAAGAAVIRFDYTGGGAFFDHGGSLENFVLDGGGFAVDGLSLKGVISANFPNIRVTNVTGAGLHMHWAQLCYFENFTVSDNVETFTTTPVNGVLADTASCSANTFTNICIEKVSGAGIKGISLVNSLFLNGTSEGNGTTGIELGETPAAALTAIGNTFVGMDLEVNPTADIICYASTGNNDFIGLKAGFSSGAVQIKANSTRNFFSGGITGGFAIEAGANNNTITSVSLLGVSATITDAGSNNRINDVYNISTPLRLPDTKLFTRTSASVAAAGSYTINCKTADYVVLEAAGSTMTVAAPTNAIDGQAIDVSIWNVSGGALTVTWNAVFRTNGWVDPANGANRSIRFRYNSSFGRWYPIAMSQTDVAN